MADNPPFDLAERTFRFACAIVRFCRKLAQEPGVSRHIAWQLADAGTSIAANYEEAKAAYSRRDFTAKSSIVLKEARESRMWLRLIQAESLAPIDDVRPLLNEANELVAIFTTSVKRLRITLTAGLVCLTLVGAYCLSYVTSHFHF
ncbi:MAG TPA: four helix bundle protein [Vicinamibacterales bacterium]|nr:four helix bundle protein [Vicinamibacterales bacterium]